EGGEFIYVLECDAILHYGEKTYEIHRGASIYFDSIVPHVLSVKNPEAQAKVLAVVYTPF
ncbi:MAG: cupin domain-containing protein, partial [Alistipes sp.]|nr:cupin domain-containing protein [Alistipes sp.]